MRSSSNLKKIKSEGLFIQSKSVEILIIRESTFSKIIIIPHQTSNYDEYTLQNKQRVYSKDLLFY